MSTPEPSTPLSTPVNTIQSPPPALQSVPSEDVVARKVIPRLSLSGPRQIQIADDSHVYSRSLTAACVLAATLHSVTTFEANLTVPNFALYHLPQMADMIVNTGIGFSVGVVASVLLFRRTSSTSR
jgi:hypothetical protein